MAEAIIHPDSLRAMAYQVLNQLYGAAPVDDSNITIYQIEPELKYQYGLLLEKDDQQRIRLGQRPDPSRVIRRSIVLTEHLCQDCNAEIRTATLPDYLSYNGKPYVTEVGACGMKFLPVTHSFQLAIESKRTRRPTFTIEGTELRVHLTEQTIAVEEIEVVGAYKDPYFGLDQNDPVFWQRPWAITPAYKALIKERAEIRIRGGSVATWQRADKKNNGVETPINQPTT